MTVTRGSVAEGRVLAGLSRPARRRRDPSCRFNVAAPSAFVQVCFRAPWSRLGPLRIRHRAAPFVHLREKGRSFKVWRDKDVPAGLEWTKPASQAAGAEAVLQDIAAKDTSF